MSAKSRGGSSPSSRGQVRSPLEPPYDVEVETIKGMSDEGALIFIKNLLTRGDKYALRVVAAMRAVPKPGAVLKPAMSAAEEWDRAILYDLFVALAHRRQGVTDRNEWKILERADALLKKWRKRG